MNAVIHSQGGRCCRRRPTTIAHEIRYYYYYYSRSMGDTLDSKGPTYCSVYGGGLVPTPPPAAKLERSLSADSPPVAVAPHLLGRGGVRLRSAGRPEVGGGARKGAGDNRRIIRWGHAIELEREG